MAVRIGRRALFAGAGVAAMSARLRTTFADTSPLRLGLSLPLSGPAQIVGAEIKIGADVAVAQVNRGGGVNGRLIELAVIDDRGDPNQAIAGLHDFVGKDIHLIIGGALTTTALATAPTLDSLNIIFQVLSSPALGLTHELFNRRMFCDLENNYTRMRSFASFVTQRYPEVKTWIGAVSDNASGNEAWSLFSYNLQQFHKGKANNVVTFSDALKAKPGSTDFKDIISTIAASPAEGLFTLLVGADGISFYQQMRAFGLQTKIKVFAENALESALPQALKKNMPENVWTFTQWAYSAFKDLPEARELAAATEQKGEAYPYGLAAMGHTAVKAYAAALRATGGVSDTDKIIAALESVKFDTVRGNNYFRREDHQNMASVNIVNFVPNDSPQGWGVREVVTLSDSDNINAPTPGVAFKLE